MTMRSNEIMIYKKTFVHYKTVPISTGTHSILNFAHARRHLVMDSKTAATFIKFMDNCACMR